MSLFRKEFRVIPAQNGSFIVTTDDPRCGETGSTWAFSTLNDLLTFFNVQSQLIAPTVKTATSHHWDGGSVNDTLGTDQANAEHQ